MDVVFPYRRVPDDFELRYSLRSLANVPHGQVIIAGDVPSVTSDAVVTVQVPRYHHDRYVCSTANILATLDQVSDEFIVMNDDFFVLKPWTFEHAHKGTIEEALADSGVKGEYRSRIAATRSLLRSHGVADPLFFGLHIPTVYRRDRLADLVREFPMPRYRYLLRTMYWNLYPQPSIRRDDVKVKEWTEDSEAGDVLSISDQVARLPVFREWINRQFPVVSRYEVI